MHHEENPIENMEDSELDPIVYIGSLLGATKDGKLTLTYYPDDGTEEYTQTYTMDWTEEDAVAVAHRYYDLQSALDQIGLMHEQLTDCSQAEELLSPELLTVWKTYVAPFEDHCFDQEEIFNIQMKKGYEVLTEEEFALLEEYWEWYEQQCLQRLPYNRCSPAELINRARRYEKLVSLRAPKIILNNEALRLAEEMVLYCCMKK